MQSSRRTLALTVLVAVWALGCDGPMEEIDAGPPPAPDTGPPPTPDAGPPDTGVDYQPVTLYTPVDLPDDELADQAVGLLVGTAEAPRCRTCHGLTPDKVRSWAEETAAAIACIGALDPNYPDQAHDVIDCGRTAFVGDPARLGLVATATSLEFFTRAFDVYFPMTARPEQSRFLATARMPQPPGVLLTQDEVDVLLTWAQRGVPGVDDRLRIDGGLVCTPEIGPEVAAHVTAMQTEGWSVLNRDRGVAMLGCGTGESGAACLTTFPASTERTYASGWAVDGTLRILYEYDYRSSYWTRSSADGRFVSHGGSSVAGAGASVIDLERRVNIPAEALYDPSFMPDNTGFALQGTSMGGGFCRQSLLYTEPTRITFLEPECSVFRDVGLYQHVGAVDGGDYWTVFGQFVSDNGGHTPKTTPLDVTFDADATLSLVPLVYDGSMYVPGARIPVATPFEGDTAISPSGRLLISRARADDGSQAGFVLRQLVATPSGTSYTVSTPTIGHYCGRGSKVGFSYDERYIAFHRYVLDEDAIELGFTDASDPGFLAYQTSGAANVYVTDLTTGATRRITNMGPGQYALFPHFRSDGWIYFNVRDSIGGPTSEVVVASDAVLVSP